MRLLFASDSFKGTISSAESAAMLADAAREVFGADVECASIPVADGGEGTTEAIVTAVGGSMMTMKACGPLWDEVDAFYGIVDKSAVIETAAASGLPLVPQDKLNPMLTTTYGTGQLIADAMDKGCNEIYIALGGSATNDGGMGCLRALGVRFLDAEGSELKGCGADLAKLRSVDVSGLDPRVASTKFICMCDVRNPLCGEKGATMTYSAQKGADAPMQEALEAGMCNYRDVLRSSGVSAVDPDCEGAGAAGGLGAALMFFLGAQMRRGIETVLELTRFDEALQGVDLVVTGEGRTDWQSCFGKVMQGVGEHCERAGVPAVALVGALGKDADNIFDCGICSMMTTVTAPMPLQQALDNAKPYYEAAARRLFRFIRTGMAIGRK